MLFDVTPYTCSCEKVMVYIQGLSDHIIISTRMCFLCSLLLQPALKELNIHTACARYSSQAGYISYDQ